MKCHRCGVEMPESESRLFQGQRLCEDCYIKAISPEKECDPWATYVSSQERGGPWPRSTGGLTGVQKSIYEFIKTSGRTTRDQLKTKYGLSAEDLDNQLNVLMHSELIKERSEGNNMYLIPIPVSRQP